MIAGNKKRASVMPTMPVKTSHGMAWLPWLRVSATVSGALTSWFSVEAGFYLLDAKNESPGPAWQVRGRALIYFPLSRYEE